MVIPPGVLIAKNKGVLEREKRERVDKIVNGIMDSLEQKCVTGGEVELWVYGYGDVDALELAFREFRAAGYGVSYRELTDGEKLSLNNRPARGLDSADHYVMATVAFPDEPLLLTPQPAAKRSWWPWR